MSIELEKILPISVEAWCEGNRKVSVGCYNFIGISYYGEAKKGAPKQQFSQKVPNNAIAVLNYTVTPLGEGHYEANGTAVLKKENNGFPTEEVQR